MRVHVCYHECVRVPLVCAHACGARVTIRCILLWFSTFYFETGSLHCAWGLPRLVNSAKLEGQQSPRICCILSSHPELGLQIPATAPVDSSPHVCVACTSPTKSSPQSFFSTSWNTPFQNISEEPWGSPWFSTALSTQVPWEDHSFALMSRTQYRSQERIIVNTQFHDINTSTLSWNHLTSISQTVLSS